MDNKKIGKLIASLRKKEGLTQQELGDKIGVGFRAVSKWERGLNLPDIGNMTEFSKMFGITLDELMAGELKEVSEEPKTKKKISPKIKITISIITVIMIILTSILTSYRNKTYTYDMVSANKEEYYVEGQVTFSGNEISIMLNKLKFNNNEFSSLTIKQYGYKLVSNDVFLFGYGQTLDGSFMEKEETIQRVAENFQINYNDKTNLSRKKILEKNIFIIIEFIDMNDCQIMKEIEISLFPSNQKNK